MFLDHLVRKRKNDRGNTRYWTMTLNQLNNLETAAATAFFLQCCSAPRWATAMAGQRPYRLRSEVLQAAADTWQEMQYADFMAAFDGHPKIGDPASLKEKYRNTLATASSEQSAVDVAPDQILDDLAEYNQMYEKRFGYIFIVCATGKSAQEMLAIIKARINNDPASELEIAAAEQANISGIRINNMIEPD
jgi:2-oxo-4-hydroxy-4-carboxy-5-ureidoimidazoline decarboxylase